MNIPIVHLLTFAITLWLAIYILSRARGNPGMIFASMGLVSYCVIVVVDILPTISEKDSWIRSVLTVVPALSWLGAIIYLLPIDRRLPLKPVVISISGCLALGLVLILRKHWITALPLMLTLIAISHAYLQVRRNNARPASIPLAAAFSASIFFALGIALYLFPAEFLSRDLIQLGIAFDMFLLAYGVITLDAYDNGEVFRQDAFRSLIETFLAVILFTSQIVIIAVIDDIPAHTTTWLLTAAITTAILFQTLSSSLQSLLDRVTLPQNLHSTRSALRVASEAALRSDSSQDILAIDADKFYQIVRRALSDMHDPGRLAANPLTRLPYIDIAIASQQREDTTLARGIALKVLLTDRIIMLKPPGDSGFGTTDEWRYFNALYYPYVVGIKPYSRRFFIEDLDDEIKSAVEWFRSQVPERTLYNWQKSGAKIIADNLRETVSTRI